MSNNLSEAITDCIQLAEDNKIDVRIVDIYDHVKKHLTYKAEIHTITGMIAQLEAEQVIYTTKDNHYRMLYSGS